MQCMYVYLCMYVGMYVMLCYVMYKVAKVAKVADGWMDVDRWIDG